MTLHRFALAAASTALAALSGACSADAPPSRTNLAIDVAPLTLPGVGDACYGLVVTNEDGVVVWSEPLLCSDRFGDGRGALTYVGPCDASRPRHTIALTLVSLEDVDGQPITDFVNPTKDGPLEVSATCVENADTPVTFNLTIMRGAEQGFFDVAIDFADVFCSAKLDCAAGSLLFDPVTGERLPTAVAGLACTGGPDAATHLYYSDVQLVCDGVSTSISLLHAPGNLYSSTAPAPQPLAQVATFQGVEQLQNDNGAPLAKAFFNVAFGLPAGATGNCSLSFTAAVSDGALEGCATPATATVYPVIRFDAPSFISNGAFACSANPLDRSAAVKTAYVRPEAPERFAVEAAIAGDALSLSACRCEGPACCRSYPIHAAQLVHMPNMCSATVAYSDSTAPWGIGWIDRGTGSVTSASVTLNPGLSCYPSGVRTASINGTSTTPATFTLPSTASCTCNPEQGGTVTLTLPVESYVAGGPNQLLVSGAQSVEGLQAFAGTDSFATVEVCYDQAPPAPLPCDDVVCQPPGKCQMPGVCNQATGLCEYAPAVGARCNNSSGNPCLVDECDATGACVDTTKPGVPDGTLCDNGTGPACHQDVCDAAGNCNDTTTVSPQYTPCDDGDACTSPDFCDRSGGCFGNATGFTCGAQCCQFGSICVDDVCTAPPAAQCLSFDTTVRDGGACPATGCPTSCLAILEADPSALSGVYMVDPTSSGTPFPVRCDMDYDGGGWTLVGAERAGHPGFAYPYSWAPDQSTIAAGALQYLGRDTANASDIAAGTGDGLIGVRFPWGATYHSARLNWCDPTAPDSLFARFDTPEELFSDTRRDCAESINDPLAACPFFATQANTITLSNFETNDNFLHQQVPNAGAARFCRSATLAPSWRPGDTSWAVKGPGDGFFECGCSSGYWSGVGTYYGGEQDMLQNQCIGWGGGFAGSVTYGDQKGGITRHELHVWIR